MHNYLQFNASHQYLNGGIFELLSAGLRNALRCHFPQPANYLPRKLQNDADCSTLQERRW